MREDGLESLSSDVKKQLNSLKNKFPRSRFLLACKSCYHLKPPVIVEIGYASECSWCLGRDNEVLLFETKQLQNEEYVEYASIRERKSTSEFANHECEDNLGLRWKSCLRGDDCTFAHSRIEWNMWRLESHYRIKWNHVNAYFKANVADRRATMMGVFHCFVCCKNLLSGKEFSVHCDSSAHKRLMVSSGDEVQWIHRPLPENHSGRFVLCTAPQYHCRSHDRCPFAHSKEELEEWNRRFALQTEKLKVASETGLVSFADRILQEYERSSSSAEILQRSLPGVTITLNHQRKQKVLFKQRKFAWTLTVKCMDTKMKLNHAAFLHESSFKICRVRSGRRSNPTSHLDLTVAMNEDHLLNLYDGSAVFEVTCKPETYGIHRGKLVFEFFQSPRPVLLVEFAVEVVESEEDGIISSSQREEEESISWESNRRIMRWGLTTTIEFDKVMNELLNKYKVPDAALDFSRDSSNLLDPNLLQLDNYVEKMHNFLYREEDARTKRLAEPRCFSIAITENYISAKKGICFNTPGELFAVFELPMSLNRDTDEGFLILENCSKVLIGRRRFSEQPVYEAMIEEKFVDHMILRFSKACVDDWNLRTGLVVEAEIKFQLDRERFCRCHCALDELKQRNLLPLVCPDIGHFNKTANYYPEVFDDELDEDQKAVLSFMKSTSSSKQNSVLPLFLVQGSFGTGKTYTISKCILSLLESDPDAKLLVCTHSNSAADRYIQTNFQNYNEWKDKVVRILYHGRQPQSVDPLVKKYCLWSEDERGFRYPTDKDVARHKVFITTFETSLALGIKGTGLMGAFTHIFLDEAAQAMEAAAIIPLTLADSTKTKIVVAGDHKQISEKIYSTERLGGADDATFTLLTRIYRLYSGEHMFWKNLVVLRNNYRCISPILRLIESLFYKENFLTARTQQPFLPGLPPIQFHDIEGNCIQDPFTSDYYNEAEALQIVEIVKFLLEAYPFLMRTDIVVVSSYTQQVRIMRSHLRAQRLGSVVVERVRQIQGLEYKVVILSCVHKRKDSSDKNGGNSGLLSDTSLLNTAFTRSMLAVIAVGHAATLWSLGKCSIMWHKFLRTCEEQQGLFPVGTTVESIRTVAFGLSELNPDAGGFVPGARIRPSPSTSQTPSSQEEDDTYEYASDNEESDSEALPLKDEILDDIIQRETGSSPGKTRIKVDPHGREFIGSSSDGSSDTQNNIHSEFSRNQLKELLRGHPAEYKRCVLDIINWNSAEAIVLDPDPDVTKVLIKTKRALGRSFDKDEVVVHVTPKNEDAPKDEENLPYGKVIGVLNRYDDLSQKKFVCVPDPVSPGLMVPVNRKVTKFIALGMKGIKEPESKVVICQLRGEAVKRIRTVDCDKHSVSPYRSHFVVRFVKWPPNCTYPFGYVSEEIQPKKIEKYFSVVHDVPEVEHRKTVEKKASELAKAKLPSKQRTDLTNLFTFTIDPPGSKDLDDALSVEKCDTHNKCYKIGIHIADVASVVPEGSPVDTEAQKRATTFYSGVKFSNSPRKISPMLPASLSTDKCSLLPDRKRPAISICLHSSHLPDIISPPKKSAASNLPTPILTMIQSRRQMNYKEAEDCMRQARQSSDGLQRISTATTDNLPDQLQIIWKAMLGLRLKRLDGASFTARPEFNELNRFFEETTAHMLIEEAMITYNACISRFLEANNCTFIMRTQDPPTPDESKNWRETSSEFIALSLNQQSWLSRVCREAGVVSRTPQALRPLPVFPHVLEQIDLAIQRKDLESALVLLCSDAIQPAVVPGLSGFLGIQKRARLQTNVDVHNLFGTSGVTHFSLRLPAYSHCSSPIRRYTDIMAQRLVLLKCQQRHNDSNVIRLEHVGQSGNSASLKILSKKLEKRMEDAKKYERDTQNVSFAKSLSEHQRYEEATVVEINDRDIVLNLLCLRDLPLSSRKLTFRELNLLSQDGSTLKWRIRFFDVKHDGETASGISHKELVSTTVSSRGWVNLLHFIRNSFAQRAVDPKAIKNKFQSMIESRREVGGCVRQPGDGPCDNDECRRNRCKDVLVFPSKLGISHFRRITMSLSLGMPLCVQLYCGVEKGISIAMLQLLSFSQDLDICLAHLRSPIEIFAADVTPKRGNGNFPSVTAYIEHWKPLYRMDAIYNAIKDGDNASTLQNVSVEFTVRGDEYGGKFSLNTTFSAKRLISITRNDFLCIRIKNLSVREFDGPKQESSVPETESVPDSCFTWVAHAVVTESEIEKGDEIKCKFKICTPQVSRPKYSNLIKNGNLLATVEVLRLGIANRSIMEALEEAYEEEVYEEESDEEESDDEDMRNKEVVTSLCLDQGLSDVRPRTPLGLRQQAPQEVETNEISVGAEVVPGMRYQLNDGQIEQIQLALGRNVSMIQGPPGTGKSFVGAHLAYYFQELNKKKLGKAGKVLYCGPSNKSVDVVAEYLLDSNLKVLRVYGFSYEEMDYPNPLKPALPIKQTEKRPDKRIADISLHHKIRQLENPFAEEIKNLDSIFKGEKEVLENGEEDLYELYKTHRKLVKDAKHWEMKHHDVIICTCATASMLPHHTGGFSIKFTQCIIDECAMCSEPETLAPVITSKAKQVVLIGDHMQLQPIILCPRAKNFGLGVSMFERLNHHAGMLTTQYRMHPGICGFPSKQFYEEKLITDVSVLEREAERSFNFCYPHDKPDNTAIFCHIVGVEKINFSLERGGENSQYNEDEANAVIRILVYLHITKRVPLSSIMILSPYTAQVNIIKKMITKERSQMKDVHVGTVITSQGSERDYVILSTVRSQRQTAIEDEAHLHWRRKYIGFVTDPHQVNVAITRAKSGLCIVGNKHLLRKDTETWKPLLEYYEERGSVVDFAEGRAPWNMHYRT